MTDFETRRLSQIDGVQNSPEEPFEAAESYDDAGLGQVLDQLEARGAIVFSDVPGAGFHLEHVAIHPTGVYVLETGTTSRSVRRVVNFDGSALRLDEEVTDEPVARARAASNWLQGLLQAATGRPVLVRPTLLFPGWFVESEQALEADMLVLNPGALPSFVANARPVLSRQDVMLVAYHLSRYIASGERR